MLNYKKLAPNLRLHRNNITTIKIKTALEYNLDNMNAELQFAKIAVIETQRRIKEVMQSRDFASYHSAEDVKNCMRKLTDLSEILQQINRIEPDIKYFKNKSLLLYKESKKAKS